MRTFDSYVMFHDWGIGILLGPVEGNCSQYRRLGTILWDFAPLTFENRILNLHALPIVADATEYLNGAGVGWVEVCDQLFG